MLRRFRVTLAAAMPLAGCTLPRPADPPPVPATSVRIVPSCVVSAEGLVAITVEVDDATGDTTFQGQPLSTAFPLTSRYAADADWYVRNEPIPEVVWPHVNARGQYVKYGSPQIVSPASFSLLGYHHGVGVYAVLGDAPESLRHPLRPRPSRLLVPDLPVRGRRRDARGSMIGRSLPDFLCGSG